MKITGRQASLEVARRPDAGFAQDVSGPNTPLSDCLGLMNSVELFSGGLGCICVNL